MGSSVIPVLSVQDGSVLPMPDVAIVNPGVTDMSTGQSGSGNRFAILNAAAEEDHLTVGSAVSLPKELGFDLGNHDSFLTSAMGKLESKIFEAPKNGSCCLFIQMGY